MFRLRPWMKDRHITKLTHLDELIYFGYLKSKFTVRRSALLYLGLFMCYVQQMRAQCGSRTNRCNRRVRAVCWVVVRCVWTRGPGRNPSVRP